MSDQPGPALEYEEGEEDGGYQNDEHNGGVPVMPGGDEDA